MVYLLRNPRMHYAWGSRFAIPELLGEEVSAQPCAELWMGGHVKASSELYIDGAWVPLRNWIEKSPEHVLGSEVLSRYGCEMPFLLKVLASEQPLSIQAHPNREQADRGFLREEAAGIALTAKQRNYRDRNHKPELICALTPFWALRGFRTPLEVVRWMRFFVPGAFSEALAQLEQAPSAQEMFSFYQMFLNSSLAEQSALVELALERISTLKGEDLEAVEIGKWIRRLAELYPGDVSVLSPAMLNLVQLQPGEAMFLPDGELHAYLHGLGLEIMANSDNVLRGGLTHKHVDKEELLRVLRFTPTQIERLQPQSALDCAKEALNSSSAVQEEIYQTPCTEFQLSRIGLEQGRSWVREQPQSVEILFCLKGVCDVRYGFAEESSLCLLQGASCVVPFACQLYALYGEGEVYRAT
ncbi:MAG: mannose-6-phosphate isomerase, class I, partial [Myxococcota bacterium]